MINIFLSLASCKIYHEWSSNPSATDRDFNLLYTVDGDEEIKYTSTYLQYGWRVQLRYPAGSSGTKYPILGSNQGVLTQGNFKITTEFDESLGDNFLRVIFNVQNTGQQVERFDLGAYADIRIGNDDDADVDPLPGGIGFSMIARKVFPGHALALLAKKYFNVTDVDTFNYGPFNGGDNVFGRNKTNLEPLRGTDSMFELAWLDRSIDPGHTLSFNVIVAIGREIRLPPQVDGHLENNTFEANTDCSIPVTYKSIYSNIPIDLYYQIGDNGAENKVDEFTTTEEQNSKDFTVKFNCGDYMREKKVIIFARDRGTTMKSNLYTENLIINKRPTFTMNGNPQPELYWGEKIEVPITLVDDTKAKIVGEINGQKYEGELNPTNTKVTFKIPTDSLPSKPYELKVYAVDENGYKSAEEKTFQVQVKEPPPPIFESDPVISRSGDTVTVTARVQNPLQREYKVKTVINGQTHETTIPKTEGNGWAEVKYQVKIPEDPKNEQNVKISVIDSRDQIVKEFEKKVPISSEEPGNAGDKPPGDKDGGKTDDPSNQDKKKPTGNKDDGKNKSLLWAIIGSVAGALAIIGGVTYYFLVPAKKKNEEEEEKSERYIDEVQLTDHIAKEVASVNNEIFPVNVENLSEGEALDFVTQDPIDL